MSTNAARIRAHRRRKREGLILIKHLEISNEVADNLVEAGALAEWDTENPDAIAKAIIKLLMLLPERSDSK